MVRILLLILIGGNAVASLFHPWIGVVISYLFALLQPHTIWWWAFGDIRPMYTVLLPTLMGFALWVMRGKVDYSILNTKFNKCVAVLWVCFVLSYYFGPYVDVINAFRFYDAPSMFVDLNKTYITYFIAAALIVTLNRLKLAALVIVVTVGYMTYWANTQYLFGGAFGRMHGPLPLSGYSIYGDENIFGALFVTGFPFLFYFGHYLRNTILKWAIWAVIPLAWHAVFLTASRGALLGCGAVVGAYALRSEKKAVGIIVVIAFIGAFAWQAGEIMKSRSGSITNYEDEHSASARIDAWIAATKMVAEHPITGVGFASFGQAFPDYSTQIPRIAHNTIFQIAGEWGLVAVITYLILVFSLMNRLRRNGNRLREEVKSGADPTGYYLNEACLYGFIGFFTCSFFLSLEKYDMLYYLVLLANATLIVTGYKHVKAAARAPLYTPVRRAAAGVKGRTSGT